MVDAVRCAAPSGHPATRKRGGRRRACPSQPPPGVFLSKAPRRGPATARPRSYAQPAGRRTRFGRPASAGPASLGRLLGCTVITGSARPDAQHAGRIGVGPPQDVDPASEGGLDQAFLASPERLDLGVQLPEPRRAAPRPRAPRRRRGATAWTSPSNAATSRSWSNHANVATISCPGVRNARGSPNGASRLRRRSGRQPQLGELRPDPHRSLLGRHHLAVGDQRRRRASGGGGLQRQRMLGKAANPPGDRSDQGKQLLMAMLLHLVRGGEPHAAIDRRSGQPLDIPIARRQLVIVIVGLVGRRNPAGATKATPPRNWSLSSRSSMSTGRRAALASRTTPSPNCGGVVSFAGRFRRTGQVDPLQTFPIAPERAENAGNQP